MNNQPINKEGNPINESNINIKNNTNQLIALVNRLQFQNIINIALSVVSKKSPMTVLSNICLQFYNQIITISATNLETLIIQQIDADISLECDTVVKAHILNEVLKQSIGENIKIFTNHREMIIVDESGEFKLINSEEKFPVRNLEKFETIIEFESNHLVSMIKNTNINVDSNEGGAMNLYLENNQISCMVNDRRRFSYISCAIENNKEYKLSINPKLRKELIKLNSKNKVQIKIHNQEFILQTDKLTILSRIYNSTNIDYKNFLQNKESMYHFKCKTSELSKGLSRVITLSSILTRSIKLTFSTNLLELSSFDPSSGSSKSIIKGDGDFSDYIYINGDYMIEAIGCAHTDETIIYFQNNKRQLMIDCDAIHIIMPIRV